MIEDMTDQAKSPRSRRGSVATGPASRERANSTSRAPGKAQEAVNGLLDKIRAKADRNPPAASGETNLEEKRSATGLFVKGTKPGPGRPPGSPNKIPRAVKEVIKALREGALEVVFADPITNKVVTGPVAHLMAERIVTGLNDPDHYPAFVKMLLEYGISRPKSQTEVVGEDRRQIPTMIFLHEPRDSMAKSGDPPKPLRILGQIAGPDGDIIEAKTGRSWCWLEVRPSRWRTASARAKSAWS
jgi:hypothetical protein